MAELANGVTFHWGTHADRVQRAARATSCPRRWCRNRATRKARCPLNIYAEARPEDRLRAIGALPTGEAKTMLTIRTLCATLLAPHHYRRLAVNVPDSDVASI